MFYTVFALAFGGIERLVGDTPYMVFLAPGLLMMTMAQNAFANTSSSMVIGKVQGNIVDVLMPPLSAEEFYFGYMMGGMLRGLCVGAVTGVVVALVVHLPVHSFVTIVLYGVLGTMLMSTLGLAAGIWSEKFDHIAAVTNFIVTPLTFLSGTFYSAAQLPEVWQTLVHFNPFFYMIDGFRFGFTGHADGSITAGIAVLTGVNIALALLTLWMIRSGYKIKS
jgi:ABC-2 type transport system permease protein